MADPMLGQIILFAGNYAPVNWAFCEGQLLAISENQALYSILGTLYGGDGRINFALPDFRGRTPVSAGQGPSLTNYIIGYRGGSERFYITTENMPTHSHEAVFSKGQVTSAVSGKIFGEGSVFTANQTTQAAPDKAYAAPLSASFSGQTVTTKGYGTSGPGGSMATDCISVEMPVTGQATGPLTATVELAGTGGSDPVRRVQPYTALRYIIAIEGWYPSRN